MNEILATIYLTLIAVTAIVGDIYTNKKFLKQSKENFERIKKLELISLADVSDLRKRLDGMEGDTFSIIELRKRIEKLEKKYNYNELNHMNRSYDLKK